MKPKLSQSIMVCFYTQYRPRMANQWHVCSKWHTR